jgi:hypothetical protein
MKYLENFNKYKNNDNLPLNKKVNDWLIYLDENYPISVFENMKTIQISGKMFYLSGPYSIKSKLKEKLFLDIKYYADDYGSVVHIPSLRKAIKIWIDKNSTVNENINNFDIDFAIAKIKEHFSFEKVKKMLDKEILEWTPESESETFYSEHSNGEAEDTIITHMIDWYHSKYPSEFSDKIIDSLRTEVQNMFEFLKY